MNWKVPLFKTYTDEPDVESVAQVIRRGTYWAVGPEIQEFEKLIADFVGVDHALAVNSGTSALHLALLALGVQDKEVIVPSFTFIASANAVVLAGGIPVFAEVEEETFGLDAADVARRITDRTAAIMPMPYGGIPSRDSEKIAGLAAEHDIAIIEDSAESLGAKRNGVMVGTYGRAGIFSLCQNKVLATGEGGIVVTDDRELYERMRLLRSHGRVERAKDYFEETDDNDYTSIGFNYRMSSMTAALGISQFAKMNEVVSRRRARAARYDAAFAPRDAIGRPARLEGSYEVFQMYTIRFRDEQIRDRVQRSLEEARVMSKVYFNPVHLKTAYRERFGCAEGDLPFTEELSSRVLNIPLYPDLTEEQQDLVIQAILKEV